MTDELIFSVREVFGSYLTNHGKLFYNIPAYQRGYKWNKANIVALLKDLLDFQKSNPKNSFYCLQNITIVPEGDHYNVVDGQQRLTTLYILLSYLKKQGAFKEEIFKPECLRYSVRTDTATLLTNDIATGIIWDSEKITPDNAKNKDAWYILDVANAISSWFKEHNEQELDVNIVLDHLKLIVNKMEEGNEASIFAGLNGGKVDLDLADLVRAEMITRAAREKYNDIDPQKVGEFRAHIGLELDELGRWWGEPNHKTFFSQLLPEIKTDEEFKDAYPINLLYRLYFAAYNKNEEFGFKFFEHGRDLNGKPNDNHWELYDSMMKMHAILKEWYDDPSIYHWIGYLFFNFKSYKQVDFASIWNLWQIDSEDRSSFIKHLKKLTRELVVSKEGNDDNAASRLVDSIKDLKHDWYHDDLLDEVLILSEILWLEENQFQNRLLPKYLRQHKEQREHIRSCHPNSKEGKDETSVEAWKNFILKVYDDSDPLRTELISKIVEFNTNTLSDDQIMDLNNKMNEYHQNSIGNIVLLDSHINESYGNAYFQEKIQRIIKEFMSAERYIRPYTLNVFLNKIGDQDFEWRWTKANIEENADRIGKQYEKFLIEDTKLDQNG